VRAYTEGGTSGVENDEQAGKAPGRRGDEFAIAD
jgi:hypothetical protein